MLPFPKYASPTESVPVPNLAKPEPRSPEVMVRVVSVPAVRKLAVELRTDTLKLEDPVASTVACRRSKLPDPLRVAPPVSLSAVTAVVAMMLDDPEIRTFGARLPSKLFSGIVVEYSLLLRGRKPTAASYVRKSVPEPDC